MGWSRQVRRRRQRGHDMAPCHGSQQRRTHTHLSTSLVQWKASDLIIVRASMGSSGNWAI